MVRISKAAVLMLLCLCGPVAAQSPNAGAKGKQDVVSASTASVSAVSQDVSPARIAALRASAKPLLDFVKTQSSELAALKRQHAAAKKQSGGNAAAGDGGEKARKQKKDLRDAQRKEWETAINARRAEHAKFTKKNAAAKEAMEELLRLGIPLEEPAK